jgi:hypothetical protein
MVQPLAASSTKNSGADPSKPSCEESASQPPPGVRAGEGMRDFAEAVRAQMRAAGASDSDEALWSLLRRFQILVFDFESPGAVSTLLVEALAKASLPVSERHRHQELWSALIEKALSYDADGGEITRAELVTWLKHERGLDVVAGRGMALARQRFADHSGATLAAIDDRIAGIALDRSSRVEAIAAALDVGRFVEIIGDAGSGKSALLKALAAEEQLESRPFVLRADHARRAERPSQNVT